MRPTERAEDWEDFKHQVITNALRVLPQLLQLKQLIINFTFYLLTREQHTIIRFLNHNSMFNDFSEM